jgi:hypothetical protein
MDSTPSSVEVKNCGTTRPFLFVFIIWCLIEHLVSYIFFNWELCGEGFKSSIFWNMSTSGGRSVGIVRSRTKGHGVCIFWNMFTAVTMNDVVFWVMIPCEYNNNWCFGGKYRLQYICMPETPRLFYTLFQSLLNTIFIISFAFCTIKLG